VAGGRSPEDRSAHLGRRRAVLVDDQQWVSMGPADSKLAHPQLSEARQDLAVEAVAVGLRCGVADVAWPKAVRARSVPADRFPLRASGPQGVRITP